jgi:hypothetical protein
VEPDCAEGKGTLFQYYESALTRTLDFAYRQQCCPKTIYGHFLVSTSISFDKDFDIGWLNGKPYELPRIDQTLILVLPDLGVFLRRLCRIPSTSMSVPDRQRKT